VLASVDVKLTPTPNYSEFSEDSWMRAKSRFKDELKKKDDLELLEKLFNEKDSVQEA